MAEDSKKSRGLKLHQILAWSSTERGAEPLWIKQRWRIVGGAPQQRASGTPPVPQGMVILNGPEIEGGRRFVDN
ncbi:hypothetical protein K0M31_008238 [Melipona bicolor]|uniref:Uncharacterized protein n=1 Tax=Melipona bicolor TaxID=60889 RepID=A0AA40KK91_9HYME|nr:hypothetical protein K0M31_008238 [Melipona bicolor]